MLALTLKAHQQVTITKDGEVLTLRLDLDEQRSRPGKPYFKAYFAGPESFSILRANAKKRQRSSNGQAVSGGRKKDAPPQQRER